MRRRRVVAAAVIVVLAVVAVALVTAEPQEPPPEFWYPVKPGPDVMTCAGDGPSGRPLDVDVLMSSEMQMFCAAPMPRSWWEGWLFWLGLPRRKPAWTATYSWSRDERAFKAGEPLHYVLVEDSIVR